MKLTANLGLKKPDGPDVVNIDDFNSNADKIDLEFGKVNEKFKNIDTSADKITIKDPDNHFESTHVEGALKEIAIELHGQRARGIEIANALSSKLQV